MKQNFVTDKNEDMPPLMGVANNVQKPGQEPFRKFGDVEEEREAANGVHDDDLGQHYSHDPGGQAVVHHHPVDRWNNLQQNERRTIQLMLPMLQTVIFFIHGPNPASFYLFSFFLQSKDKYSTKLTINDKSVDGVLGTRTWGGRMEGTDEPTERQPKK